MFLWFTLPRQPESILKSFPCTLFNSIVKSCLALSFILPGWYQGSGWYQGKQGFAQLHLPCRLGWVYRPSSFHSQGRWEQRLSFTCYLILYVTKLAWHCLASYGQIHSQRGRLETAGKSFLTPASETPLWSALNAPSLLQSHVALLQSRITQCIVLSILCAQEHRSHPANLDLFE